MLKRIDFEHFNLPILSPDEYEYIKSDFESAGTDWRTGYIGQLAASVCEEAPLISDVITHDIAEYLIAVDAEDDLPEVREYVQGVRDGYRFIIGCFTYVSFARNQPADVQSFLDLAENNSAMLPVKTTTELDRVLSVRDGNALIELPDVPYILDDDDEVDSDLAYYSFTKDYFDYSGSIGLLQSIIERKPAGPDSHTDSYNDGIAHGIDSAVTMYAQSREEAILNAYEAELDTDQN